MSNENGSQNCIVNLQMQGFYREESISAMADNPGIYFVFVGVRTEHGCRIRRCIYIGKAEVQGIRQRLLNHEKMSEFHDKIDKSQNEILYFAYAECGIEILRDIEGALIKGIQPEINVKAVESFSSRFSSIELNLDGSVPVVFSRFKSMTINPDVKE